MEKLTDEKRKNDQENNQKIERITEQFKADLELSKTENSKFLEQCDKDLLQAVLIKFKPFNYRSLKKV